MKATAPLALRDCPAGLRAAIKDSARRNRRSLNSEALTWLERESQVRRRMSGQEFARRLREARKLFTPREHAEIARRIEDYRKRNRSDTR